MLRHKPPLSKRMKELVSTFSVYKQLFCLVYFMHVYSSTVARQETQCVQAPSLKSTAEITTQRRVVIMALPLLQSKCKDTVREHFEKRLYGLWSTSRNKVLFLGCDISSRVTGFGFLAQTGKVSPVQVSRLTLRRCHRYLQRNREFWWCN